jgi:preprotein translocase subunit SecF
MIMGFLEKHWKQLMWITIVFLIFSIGVLAHNTLTTGSFMKRDIDLSGGKEITIAVNDVDLQQVRQALPYANVQLTSGLTKTLIVDIPFDQNETQAIGDLHRVVTFEGEPSLRVVGPSLGTIFFQQAELSLIAAFILMAITVFLLFRSPAPSSIVILCAATDILGTMAIISLLGVSLSMPVLAALLTLIGYSVDTDILLTNELLKSGRTDYNMSVRKAMKTGITMTGTALVALLAMYFVSGSVVIEEIAFVLIVGLLIDIPATWLTNSGVMRLWLERKKK